jgi:hypothetical protein
VQGAPAFWPCYQNPTNSVTRATSRDRLSLGHYRLRPGGDRLHQRVLLVREHLEAHPVGVHLARQGRAALGHQTAHQRAEKRPVETQVRLRNGANGSKTPFVRCVVASQRADVAAGNPFVRHRTLAPRDEALASIANLEPDVAKKPMIPIAKDDRATQAWRTSCPAKSVDENSLLECNRSAVEARDAGGSRS